MKLDKQNSVDSMQKEAVKKSIERKEAAKKKTEQKKDIPKRRDYSKELSDKYAAARKFNPLMSTGSFLQVTNAAHIPGRAWTSTQRAMMPKSHKRINDLTSHGARAEVKRRTELHD